MATYLELEQYNRQWNGNACIFGAGSIGKNKGYKFLKAFNFNIEFYFDNNIPENTIVQEGIVIRDNQYLYDNKDNILLFVCLAYQNQDEVLAQLKKHGVKNFVVIDSAYISNVMDSIDRAGDDIKKRYHAIYDDAEFLAGLFKKNLGYDLDIVNPKTFNEKLQWLKLYDRKPEYTRMVDKYEVKNYVAAKIGKEHIIPTLGIYDSFEEVDFEKLPKQFVLKCTHDSNSALICRDKDAFDIKKAKSVLESKLKRNYYWESREWPYKHVKPRIIVETFMKEETEDLWEGGIIDYKFYCFSGEPKFLYISGGLENHDTAKISFYNLDLTEAAFQRIDYSQFDKIPRIPTHYEEMIDMAKVLSQSLPFVRIDLYEIGGVVYFSEFTFSPCGGMMPFNPSEYDERIGELINIK